MAATGPFYFAWADAGEAFDPVVHARWDDDLFDMTLDQVEGDFATLRMQIRNPRVGLLAPGRKIWGWLSWFNGTEIVPLIFGRLVGVPDEIQDEVVEITLIARPDNFAEQKAAVAADLREYGSWDPIWFSPSTILDPDNVLEAAPLLWAIDRVTHEITTSDIIDGEDGTLTFQAADVLADSVQQTYSQNPLRRVTMTANVSWQQQAKGGFDITSMLQNADPHGVIRSYTGKGLAQAWPTENSSIGGGWSFSISTCKIIYGDLDPSIVGKIDFQGVIGLAGGSSSYIDGGFDTALGSYGVEVPGQPIGWSYHVAIPEVGIKYQTAVAFDVNRARGETLIFTLEADVQPILSEPDDQETLALSMSSSEVVAQGLLPANARAYFTTANGSNSIRYLINVARAHLLARARSVSVQFDIPFPLAVASNLSTRKNAVLLDPRMPGGLAAGKITRYTLSLSDGKANATMYIGCTVGRGGSVVPVEGEPDYVDDDYVDPDYQFHFEEFELIAAGDVAYRVIEGLLPNDDGIDFDNIDPRKCVEEFILLNNHNSDDMTQQAALSLFQINVDNTGALNAINTTFAQVRLQMIDLTGGPFTTNYDLAVTDLKIPKTIDLEVGAYE